MAARRAAAAGYGIERERGAVVVALPSVIGAVREAVARSGTLYAAAAGAPGAEAFAGRGAAYRMRPEAGDWLVRHYRRGGLVARVLDDEYLRVGEPRPLRELRASAAARARGVATPEVIAAVVYPAGIVYRADIATEFIDASADLAAVSLGDAVSRERRVGAWAAAGTLLRTAFAAGVEHADLNLRNILIRGTTDDAPEALLLDLDRARVRDREVSDAARSRMLERLHRSRRKIEQERGRRVMADELMAFEHELRGFGG